MTMPMTPIQQMMEVELVQDERMKMLMASWLRNETSRAENEELFQCGYLKVIDLKGTFAITAKGWELAHPRKPRHVSESTPPTYNFRGQSRSLVVQAPQIDSFIFDEGRSLGRISRVYGYSILHDVWLVADENDELWEVSPYHGTRPMVGDDSEPSGQCELNATTDDKEVINEWFGYKTLIIKVSEAPAKYDATKPFTVCCPGCGSTNIGEQNVAYCTLPVTGWEIEKGELVPTGFDTDVSADWATDSGPQYQCRDCYWDGDSDELIVKQGVTEVAIAEEEAK